MEKLAGLLDFAVAVSREAGDLLSQHDVLHPMKHVKLKGRRDPVTDADLASERLIVKRIRERMPEAGIWAEEEVREKKTQDKIWFIDPLDGTVNFSQAHPFYAVSIALYDGEGPVLGVVHAPRLGETFAAARGLGCTMNGTALQVSKKTDLMEAVLATGFAYRRDELPDSNVAHFADMALKVRGMRRCGSAALDLAYVAAGRLDGFWEPHLEPYDVAAGALLVKEAGGLVTDMAGGDDWLHGRTIVAAGTAIHPLILKSLGIRDVGDVTGGIKRD